MEISSTASNLLGVEQQHAHRVESASENREWLKRFALLLGLIALALTVATLLANLPAVGAIQS